MTFVAGDKVECVHDTNLGFPGKIGEILTVSKVDGNLLYFEEYQEFHGMLENGALYTRFKLHTPVLSKIVEVPPLAHVTPIEQGMRKDDGKAPMALLDPIALEGIAMVLAFGAKKYAPNNWKKGMAWSKVIGSMIRHTMRFLAGEDLDQESGLPHVDHIACNAMFLANYYRKHKKHDDRYKDLN